MHITEDKQRAEEPSVNSALSLHPSSLIPHPFRGRLRLCFELAQEGARQTVLTVCEQEPPLKVVRAFELEDGAALVHLHNVSGGVLGGDQLELAVEVRRRAAAQLTTTGATRLYRSRQAASPAAQRSEIRVGEDALLEYLPDALIPFAGSRYCQETRIELAEGAGLFWWETIAPGRLARSELFAYDLLQLKLDLTAGAIPLAQERIRLEPAKRPLSSPARLGPYRYFSTFYICRVGLEEKRWLALETELAQLAARLSRPQAITWGVSTLPAHGLVVRALSVQGRDIAPGLQAFWHTAKLRLYGRASIAPRKIY
jgi:urease accessory protein